MSAEYNIPNALEKVFQVYDANNQSLFFNTDYTRRVIWFNTDALEFPILCYGTPNKVGSGLSAIIDGLDEDYEDIIWQYIRANCLKNVRDPDWKDEFKLAEAMVTERRQYRNRNSYDLYRSLKFQDRDGNLLDSSGNIEGVPPDIAAFGELGDL